MSYEYNGVGFLFHFAAFLLAGYLGRYRIWIGIVAAVTACAFANFILGDTVSDTLLGIGSGFLAGLSGAIIIPLFISTGSKMTIRNVEVHTGNDGQKTTILNHKQMADCISNRPFYYSQIQSIISSP